MEAATAVFGVTAEELCGHDLGGRLITARQAAMYVCHRLAGEPPRAIGHRFGDRDATTVLLALRRVDRLMTERAGIHRAVVELTNRLGRAQPGMRGRRAG